MFYAVRARGAYVCPRIRQKISENKMKLKHWTGELKKLRKVHQKEAEEWGLEDEGTDDSDADSDDEASDGEEDGDASDKKEASAAEKYVDRGVEETKGGESKEEDGQQGEQESEVSMAWPRMTIIPFSTKKPDGRLRRVS